MTVAAFPLIALGADMNRRAKAAGLRTAVWNSTVSDGAKAEVLKAIARGEINMLISTAESLQGREIQSALLGNVGLAWIDEAHTTRDGNFRPALARIGRTLDEIRPRVRYSCTATSSPAEQQELIRRCGLRDPLVVRVPVERDNLTFEHVERSTHSIRQILRAHAGSRTVVYAATVKAVEALTAELESNGFQVAGYHGHLSKKQREGVLSAFTAGDVRNVVATDAFGLGIDLPDIRAVVCFDPASDVAAFVQQAGRAGRDGLPSKIYLASIAAREGWNSRRFLVESGFPPIDDMRRIWIALKRAGPQGLNCGQMEIAESAGVAHARHVASRAFTYLKRKSLVAEQHTGRDFTYFARGQFDAVNWLDYSTEKDKASTRLEELRSLWSLPADQIPAAIGEVFNV